ncbi:glycosyl hydrolase family 18 protein [Kitasatospora sp. NPDC058397]|uniref:glycosyl hydrolase family 18 protein n=1 Tax=unclassified Kitasatospora TaxID=2633591 RepID=UPI00364E1C16
MQTLALPARPPAGRWPARLLATALAALLVLGTLSWLAPPAGAWSNYSTRYRQIINEIRANTSAPLRENVRALTRADGYYLQEIGGLGRTSESVMLILSRENLYIRGFLVPDRRNAPRLILFGGLPDVADIRNDLNITDGADVEIMHFGDAYRDMTGEANRGLPTDAPSRTTLEGLTITQDTMRNAIRDVLTRPADNDDAARRTRAQNMMRITVALAEGARIADVAGVNANGGGDTERGLFGAFANSIFTNRTWTVGTANQRLIQGGWNEATDDAWGWTRDATYQPPASHRFTNWLGISAAFAVLGGRCAGGGGSGGRAALAADTCPAVAPVDAATSVGASEAYLFHGPFNARIRYQIGGSGDAFTEGPQSIYESWPLLRGTSFAMGVDSALYRSTSAGGEMYFTKGSIAIRLDDIRMDDKNAGRMAVSGSICGVFGLCEAPFASGIDSMVSAERDTLYVFSGGKYARLRLSSEGRWQTMYIKEVATEWPVLKDTPFVSKIDAVFSQAAGGTSGPGVKNRLMMFSGDRYVRLIAQVNGTDDKIENGPMSVCEGWPLLCGTMFDAAERVRRSSREGGLPPDVDQMPTDPLSDPNYLFGWAIDGGQVRNKANGKCLDVDTRDRDGRADGGRVQQWGCGGSVNQRWQGGNASGDGSTTLVSAHSGKCLDLDVRTNAVQQWACGGGANQSWQRDGDLLRNKQTGTCLVSTGPDDGRGLGVAPCPGSTQGQDPTGAGDPVDPSDGNDTGGPRPARPSAQAECRPDGMAVTPGTDTRYCDVYQGDGREWLGQDRSRRVVGYFTGWRTGQDGSPRYLVKNIPWNKVTHVNYAFAKVGTDNRISVGDEAVKTTWPGVPGAEMDPSLPYQGHFNLLTRYKRQHPRVKTLISVGGWAETSGFYAMATNADGSVNQAGIDTFAGSVVDFLATYGFDGVDVDYEYPTALPDAGNPKDWSTANPRRKGLGAGYNALMKTLREKLDRSGHYYLLTSAGSSSGYLVRGQENQPALQYQDFVNVMSYDLHGSWNYFVGPQAPLYDGGDDAELDVASVYAAPEYRRTGYFNTDWAYHYYRGALQPGRINLGIPYYTRGWKDVQGGTDGLWGSSVRPDQANCPPGTGGKGGRVACGSGAVGIDNLWHDTEGGQEVPAGSNPLWHAKNLQDGRQPGYLGGYGLTPGSDPDDRLTGGYARKWSDQLKSSWLWNADKKVFLSTEDEQSVAAKTQYVLDKGIGGVMLWELAGDYAQRPGGEYGMGYTLTSQIDQALRGKPAYGNTRANRPLPAQAVDVKVELADFPGDLKDMWPIQPKLRITNNTPVALGAGTEVSFDIPTSTPALLKDEGWKEMPGVEPGHTGPNAGGLTGDFHRVTVKLGYCEDIPPGTSRDVGIKYYLPITGPANVIVRINGKDYGSTGDLRRATGTVTPPAPAAATVCQAEDWQRGKAYSPTGGRLWAAWDKGAQGWQFEYQGLLIDHNPDQSRVHLVEPIATNPNQYWRVEDAGGGWSRITNGGRCLNAVEQRKDLSTGPCTGGDGQKWRFVPVDPASGTEGAPVGKPVHGKAFKLRSANGLDAEAANGSTTRLTHVWAGDPAGSSSAAYAAWKGSYWYAQWWTQAEPGTAEANGSSPWRKLGRKP